MRILIADDDTLIRTLVAKLVTEWGHEAVCVSDGIQARSALLQKDAPELIIMDWMMPGEEGIQVCRRIRSEKADSAVYIILLSSKSDRHDLIEALDAGADDYMTKPFDRDELRARIHVGCRILNLQAQLREKDRAQGVMQMAGAVCHEMNQPLQVILGFSQLLLARKAPSDPDFRALDGIREGAEKLGSVTRKIMRVTDTRTTTHLNGRTRIINLRDTDPASVKASS